MVCYYYKLILFCIADSNIVKMWIESKDRCTDFNAKVKLISEGLEKFDEFKLTNFNSFLLK